MMNISGSALSAERLRAEVTSANMANAETTHTEDGGPYVRKEVVFTTRNASPFRTMFASMGRAGQPAGGSVQLSQVVDDTTPAVLVSRMARFTPTVRPKSSALTINFRTKKV